MDEQRFGPYSLWFHYHEITEVPDGVRFVDKVTYTLPFGPLGAIAHAVYVKSELARIFKYRQEAMNRIFNGQEKDSNSSS